MFMTHVNKAAAKVNHPLTHGGFSDQEALAQHRHENIIFQGLGFKNCEIILFAGIYSFPTK